MNRVKIGTSNNSNIIAGNVKGNVIHTDNSITSKNKQINDIAIEIRELLRTDSNTPLQYMNDATKVIEHIENNKNFSTKLINSIKDGGIEALEAALEHPAASFIIGAINSWKEQKET